MLVVSPETVRKLPVTLRNITGRVFAIALNGVLVLVFKKKMSQKGGYVTVRFVTVREKAATFTEKEKPKAG